MKQSYLTNERIYLRAVEPEDMDIMYEMENDPSMWDISNFTVPYSRYVLRQYIEGSQCDVFADKQLRLMIVSKSDHDILGTIDITDLFHSIRVERSVLPCIKTTSARLCNRCAEATLRICFRFSVLETTLCTRGSGQRGLSETICIVWLYPMRTLKELVTGRGML